MVWNKRSAYDGIPTIHQIDVIQHSNPVPYDYMGGMVSAMRDGERFITTITAVGCYDSYNVGKVQVWQNAGGRGTYSLLQEIEGPFDPNTERWAVKAVLSGDGSTLLIPAPWADSGKGIIYVYVWNSASSLYELNQTINTPWGVFTDDMHFGYSTAITYDGRFFTVGYPYWDFTYEEFGDLSVYRRGGDGQYSHMSDFDLWTDTVIGNYAFSRKGFHCAINDDCSRIAFSFTNNQPYQGRVYVGSWEDSTKIFRHITTLNAEGTDDDDYDNRFGLGHTGCPESFSGRSIAMDSTGLHILVGAPGLSTLRGAAYYFKYNAISGEYEFVQKFTAPVGSWYWYGYHVSMSPSKKYIAIGAQGYKLGQGMVDFYVYNDETNLYEQLYGIIEPSGVASGDDPYFGYAVEVNDYFLLATATDENKREGTPVVDIGATYVFVLDSLWQQREGY